jgi:hypothetical protein
MDVTEPGHRADRRWRLLAALVLSLALAGTVAACGEDDESSDDSADAASAAAPEHEVGVIGRIDQEGPSFEGYGYVTHLSGAEDASLFAPEDSGGAAAVEASEDRALLTFSFSTDLTSRAIHPPIFTTESEGTIDFYFSEQPTGDFDDPASFTEGDRVAGGALGVDTTVSVYAPDSGIVTADGTFEQESSSSFELGDGSHELGEEGLEMQVAMKGQGKLLDPALPRSVIDFSGDLTASDD